MAEHKFWWVCGTDYSPHLSNETTAVFSAVLVMPSATTSVDWSQDPANAAPIDQVDCENQIGDWLAPWQGGVTWKLYAKSGDAIREIGKQRTVAPPIQKTDADRIAARASERLHAHVRGSGTRAMTFETSDDGRVLSYPIVAGGVSQVPAPISDSVLGTSCVFEVLRADLGATETVVALPTFQLEGRAFGPAAKGHKDCNGVPAFEFAYDGATEKFLGANKLAFSACVSNAVQPGELTWKNDAFPARRVEIRNGKPMRQVYASLSREFNPLKLWLAAITGPRVQTLNVKVFTQTLVSFLGGGEDELDEAGLAIGSIYELVLPEEHYWSLIGTLKARREDAPNALLKKFREFQEAQTLFKAFEAGVEPVSLKEVKAAVEGLAELPTTGFKDLAQAEEALAHAKTLVAALAAPEPSSRALWAIWLAVVLDKVASDAQASRYLLLQAHAAFRDERSVTPPVMEDDVLRLMNGQIDHATTFWSDVHAAPNPIQGLVAARKQLIDNIEHRGWKGINPADIDPAEKALARTALEKAYDDAVGLIVELLKDDRAEGDDPPLQLRYKAAPTMGERQIRGCILALRAGLPKAGDAVDWIEPQWITNFEAIHPDGGTRILDVDGMATFCDTQGATKSDGLEEQEVTYDGKPLFAAEEVANKHVGKGPLLLQPAPPSVLPAKLGFGMYYEAICGTVDNAGTIIEAVLREEAADSVPVKTLKSAIFEALATADAFRLLSRQPPGAPVIGDTKDHGVASETFSSEVLLKALVEREAAALGAATSTSEVLLGEMTKNRPAARIAVVYGAGSAGGDWARTSEDNQTVKVYAPTVGPKFIERWLNYDRALPKDDLRRWHRVRALTATAIDELIMESAAFPKTQVTGGEHTQAGVTHPAVKEVKVRVTWYGEDVSALPSMAADPDPIPLDHLDPSGKNWLRDEAIAIEVRQLATDNAALRRALSDPVNRKLTIEIPQGHRAHIEVLSVVDGKFLETDENCRFNANTLTGADGPYVKDGGDFVTRQPPSFWVESLPAVPPLPDSAPFNVPEAELKLVYPAAPSDAPAIFVRLANQGTVKAAWIRGFALEQKRWQWTGYPVRFPISNNLAPWLALYSGAEDSMPRLPNGNFVSNFTNAWYLKSALMHPVPLPAPRAANHMGLILTPIPRFASLLSKEVLKRCAPIHLFAVVPASPREATQRLQPPVWMEAIPLPQSMDAKGMACAPANLAVFRDPVYDTADTAVLGGIAEKLELDVPGTWEPHQLEIGVNPIFHAAPRGSKAPWLTLDLPFGLSYDRVVGGRPAQTAAVIRVQGGEGKWVLAKCRLRRLVDPELVAGSEIAINKKVATLNLRLVEDGWIPEDVAIYSTKPLGKIDFGSGCTLDFPPAAATVPTVCLITWHRERWGASKPTWRPLLKVYQTEKDTRTWTTSPDVSRAVGDKDFVSEGSRQIELKLDVEATVRRLAVSDYTESRWLTFIGSFEREVPVLKDALKIKLSGKALILTTTPKTKLPQLFQAGQLRSSLLLVFEPRRDLMRGEFAQDGGELCGVYAMAKQPESDTGPATFDVALLEAKGDIKGCNAVLIQLQRHNVEQTVPEWTMVANDWPKMIEMMFPSQQPDSSGAEASFRLLPEFIGEIKID